MVNPITVNIFASLFNYTPVGHAKDSFRVVIGQAYRGLTGTFLLLRIFSVAISVSLHVCFILDLMLISMFLGWCTYGLGGLPCRPGN